MGCKSHLINDWLELGTFAETHRQMMLAKPDPVYVGLEKP